MKNINVDISYYYIEKLTQIILSLIITPIFFKILGGEKYALIGLYVVFQNIINKLDFGIVVTFSREISFNIKNKNYIEQLTNQFEYIYFTIFILIISLFFFIDPEIFFNWSEVSGLTKNEFQYSIKLIGIIAALSFSSILYASGLVGLEKHKIVNLIKTIFHFFKFIGGAIFLFFFSDSILNFFLYLFFISLIEFGLFLISFYFYSKQSFFKLRNLNLSILKKIAPFSLNVAYITILSIFTLDFFLVIVSTKLTPIEFSYFSLMLIICRAVNETVLPVGRVIRQRLINLFSNNQLTKFKTILFNYSLLATFMSFAIAIVIYAHKELVLFAWLKDLKAVNWINEIIIFFLIGSALQASASFSTHVCHSMGKMKLLSLSQTIIAISSLILSLSLIDIYGALGAGYVWIIISSLSFLTGLVIYKVYVPRFFFKWALSVFLIIIVISINNYFISKFMPMFVKDNSFFIILESILRGMLILILSSPIFLFFNKLNNFN